MGLNRFGPIERGILQSEKQRYCTKRLEVKAASGKGKMFHKFSVRNSGSSSGDVRKLSVQRARRGYDICRERDWTQGYCYYNVLHE